MFFSKIVRQLKSMRYAKRDINISRPQMKIASLNVSAELEEFGNGKRKKINGTLHLHPSVIILLFGFLYFVFRPKGEISIFKRATKDE